MKLLFDANLSHRLVVSLSDVFPGSTHVRLVGLERATDREVWEYARINDLSIVSKDSDFRQWSFLHGQPPKVIEIRLGNCRTVDVENALRDEHSVLIQFHHDAVLAFLSLGR